MASDPIRILPANPRDRAPGFERREHGEPRRTDPVATADPNPPYGEKKAFRKITVTVPPGLYAVLMRESARRKIAGESNHLMSCLLREAVTRYLATLDD